MDKVTGDRLKTGQSSTLDTSMSFYLKGGVSVSALSATMICAKNGKLPQPGQR